MSPAMARIALASQEYNRDDEDPTIPDPDQYSWEPKKVSSKGRKKISR